MKNRYSKFLMGLAVLLVIAASLPLLSSSSTSYAQGSNLLLNPGFDQEFTTRGGVEGFVPSGWDFWSTGDPVKSDRDTFGAYVRSSPNSWKMEQPFHAVTGAAGYQRVTVETGKSYTATVYSYVYACNDQVHSCRTATETVSDAAAGAKVRIGIDPAGGTDPNSASIVWGPFATPDKQVIWQQLSVTTTATGTSMTVFLYFSSTTGMFYTEAHWDDASLGASDGSVPGQVVATPAPPTPVFVPFVVPQQARADGSLVHVVQSGDTIDSIMFAYSELYGVLQYTKENLYEFNNWRFPPDVILIGQELVILPTGYIDPATGQLLVEVGASAPDAAAAATTTTGTTATAAPVDPAATAEPGAQPTAQATDSAAPVPTTEAAPAQPVGAPVSEAVQSIPPFLPEGGIRP